MTQPASHAARARAELIEASAGTGKTSALVRRIVETIRDGADVSRIAAVTFTNAAAGEMKIRVRQALDAASVTAAGTEENQVIVRGREQLESAFIGTIHSFARQLLQRRPVEARVDPAFQELAQPEAMRLFGSIFRPWVLHRISGGSPGLRRALARFAEWGSDHPLRQLERAAWALVEWRDFPAPWRRDPFDRAAEIETLLEQVDAFVRLRNRCSKSGRDPLWIELTPIADLQERVERARSAGVLREDRTEAELIQLRRCFRFLKKGGGPYGEGVRRETVLAELNNLLASVEAFQRRADADLAVDLRDELWGAVELYESAKQRAGRLDFMDLLLKARDLLRDAEVLRAFRSSYDHLFVDEFQDTDPLQAEILLTLASDDPPETPWQQMRPAPGKLFVVGDPKQSIYRFRRADVTLYEDLRDGLRQCGVEPVRLQTSDRSLAPIQDFVNAAFEQCMGSEYLPLEGGRPAFPLQPGVVALPAPKPFGSRNLSMIAIEKCLPDTVAAFIAWLTGPECDWRVHEREGGARSIRPRDVCILFRRLTSGGKDLAQQYARALEARGIEHVLTGSKSFHQREEVVSLRTALRAIEWPDDELSIYATLRTFFGVLDSSLFKFREVHGTLSPHRELPEDLDPEFEALRDGLALLRELHARRNYHPIADTLNALLERTRAHVAFAFRKGGRRVLANVYRLLDLARSFERSEATSFRSFVQYLEAEAEAGEFGDAPIYEPSADGVRMMSVHKAKGLEFPVVILADVPAKLTSSDGCDRYVSKERRLCAQRLLGWAPPELLEHAAEEGEADRREAERLAYVAATRARDLLVVTSVGVPEFVSNERFAAASWLAPLYAALYPARERWRAPVDRLHMPGSAAASVLERPEDWSGPEDSVRPGLHPIGFRPHEVLWFDPALLELKPPRQTGLDHENVLKPSSPEHLAAGVERYRRWAAARQGAVDAASQPAFRVERISEASRGSLPEMPVKLISVRGQHPGSRRFGRLVHMLLETAAPGWGPEVLAERARILARSCGASGVDIDAAVETVVRALEIPEIADAVRAERRYREYPVLFRDAEGRMLEGRCDLVYFDGSQWTVVEYKTGPARSRGAAQAGLYAAAIAEATGQPARAVIIEL